MTATSREEWLALRNTGIGGSDAGTVLGVNRYKQPLELYKEKRGELVPDDISDKLAVRIGHGLEDFVAQLYTQETGQRVERCNTLLRHPQHQWMLGNVDRLVWEGDKRPQHRGEIRTRKLLECKTTLSKFIDSEEWGPGGTDQVPIHYLAQCQHYMAVTGAEHCDLAVLMAGPDFRIYPIARDDDLIASMIEREGEFWERVQSGAEPELVYEHPSTSDLIAKLYPGTDGQTIDLPPEAAHWKTVMDEAKEQAKLYEAVATGAKNHFLNLMKSAAIGRLPDGTGFTRKVIKRDGYTVDPVQYVDFRFAKKLKDAA
jgi:putative phage-type endonuclease